MNFLRPGVLALGNKLITVEDIVAQDALIIDEVVGPCLVDLAGELELVQVPDVGVHLLDGLGLWAGEMDLRF